jgi:hypothetical protein
MNDEARPTPAVICARCTEAILEGEERMPFNAGLVWMHRNCGLRGIIGSIAHLQGRCSCFVPGSTAGDPEGMTLRQAADAAVEEWKRLESLRRAVAGSPIAKCGGHA